MAILLDSSVIIAFFNKRDKNHKRALELTEKALIDHYGTIFISDYVFDETVTYLLKRQKKRYCNKSRKLSI
ncbi:MAG: PIN domain-containing protein [Candidatus Asgardarchaeia archaeon]